MTFHSILFPQPFEDIRQEAPDCFADLNLDQVIRAITLGKQEYNLAPYFYTPLQDVDAIRYRHEVMRQLEDPACYACIQTFAAAMRSMRELLTQAEKLYYPRQKQALFLDAVETYCTAVSGLLQSLQALPLRGRGWLGLRDYLSQYAASPRFTHLVQECQALRSELASVTYCFLIRGDSVRVRRCEDEPDYSLQVQQTFEKFRRGAVRDYTVKFTASLHMNHVEAQILDCVARLYPEIFAHLEQFYAANNAAFVDKAVALFDRQVQFYVAYLDFRGMFVRQGLHFCYPHLSTRSKEEHCRQTFDLALAYRLLRDKTPVVCNDFDLQGAERIIIVSGPNQGGKTTFARTFGQVHYLAALGCPVPGSRAQLFLFDRLFTHFEKEERTVNLRGKLQDDLERIEQILRQATPRSIIILNEIFTSTTLQDAVFLGKKIMERISVLDLLCVCVTFVVELASLGENTVSMVSTVYADNPAQRTFRIVRAAANGLSYALTVAEKHRLTYSALRQRLQT